MRTSNIDTKTQARVKSFVARLMNPVELLVIEAKFHTQSQKQKLDSSIS
ncbi:hypothetical protein BVRB_006190 [Beta vulgaris subsp. vulgaris]|uniref:Uncharacterized protein n=1 Tax=Beta vulgaris subsp. vulgaris TaxID=3555 RepID=A0A0J8B3D8_BETVV|nr:hypothetical protein BVRB_006190 [Beta vulgaris subsp. vulgaris]